MNRGTIGMSADGPQKKSIKEGSVWKNTWQNRPPKAQALTHNKKRDRAARCSGSQSLLRSFHILCYGIFLYNLVKYRIFACIGYFHIIHHKSEHTED